CTPRSPLLDSSLVLLPTRPPPRPTLFPYTTLFRSIHEPYLYSKQQHQSSSKGVPFRAHDRRSFAIDKRSPAVLSCRDAAALQRQIGEHTSELQSRENLVCRLLLEKKKKSTDSHEGR